MDILGRAQGLIQAMLAPPPTSRQAHYLTASRSVTFRDLNLSYLGIPTAADETEEDLARALELAEKQASNDGHT